MFEMDGVLIIDKPAGITSHDVVNRVRHIFKTRRVGHAGTLDPFATGVMIVLIGKATRLAKFVDKDEKEYEALVRFGFETDTGDVTGVRSAGRGERSEEKVAELLASADWSVVLARFTGEIEQVPPMYSAKKIDGKKLYEHARKGVEIDRKPIAVTIHLIEMIDTAHHTPQSALIRVVCSAGTYVRTLAQDIGRELGTGAHLTELRRTRAGRFDLSRAITLDELEGLDAPADRLLPASETVGHLPAITIAEDRVAATRNGLSTRLGSAALDDRKAVRMLDQKGRLLAVGIYDADACSIKPNVVLV
jgi:tRNA pseudouridine55 synthase